MARSMAATLASALPTAVKESLRDLMHRDQRVAHWHDTVSPLRGLRGLEVGGPSHVFRHAVPVYQVVRHLDGANFSTKTVWEETIVSNGPFNYYPGKPGRQFVLEASDLTGIPTSSYDFVLSSNCLEHVANPLKALSEWSRVTTTQGWLLLLLPHPPHTFDHRRPITTFEHIYADFESGVTEADLGHLNEILELHDLTMDPPAGNKEAFRKRSLDNFNNRCLHHHVFDEGLIRKMLDQSGYETRSYSIAMGNQIALARKR